MWGEKCHHWFVTIPSKLVLLITYFAYSQHLAINNPSILVDVCFNCGVFSSEWDLLTSMCYISVFTPRSDSFSTDSSRQFGVRLWHSAEPGWKEITLAITCTRLRFRLGVTIKDEMSKKQTTYLIFGKYPAHTQIIALYLDLQAKYCRHSRCLQDDAHIIAQK